MIPALFNGYPDVIRQTLMALLPLLGILAVSQFAFLRYPARRVVNTLIGVLFTFVGLTLFLQGVNIGYIPLGEALGFRLADLPYNWILLSIGLLMGLAVTMAEPAVHVLTQEIERASAGSIKRRLMFGVLAVGVGLSVALSMLKLLLGLPLWYLIVPGYIAVLVLARFVDSDFVSMAFDSGGVATGTMTATFMLSVTIGVATRLENTDPLRDGFGIIAIVALTPILMVLILGFVVGKARRKGAGE